MNTTTQTLTDLLADCEETARKQGAFDGEWSPTAEDLFWVTEQLGYKPTREEWAEAGLKWVGSAHVGQDIEDDDV